MHGRSFSESSTVNSISRIFEFHVDFSRLIENHANWFNSAGKTICLQDMYTCVWRIQRTFSTLYHSCHAFHQAAKNVIFFLQNDFLQSVWMEQLCLPYLNYLGAYGFWWFLIIGSIHHQRSLFIHNLLFGSLL